ncbi:hypothetical protein PT974_02478 [Cladobotryum mycophilum]|uniref:Uncharacterized protein n=1 Tax=Cladobotryum mycophilum TaxID=491253 RepID=A0ABR0SZD9_9HYPO
MDVPQSSTPLSGADRIRSLRDQDAVYRAFDAYPWTKDTAFLSGLHAILGEPNSPNPPLGSLRDMATHARIFYYTQRIGVTIDFLGYQDWLDSHPEHQPPNILPEVYKSSPSGAGDNSSSSTSAPPTEWQQAAPKADLFVDRTKSAYSTNPEGEPNYPMAFAEMIRLIQEGKPVPGIRQIPNTIERTPMVKPVGTRTVPRKPWERNAPAAADTADIARARDLEFPPVEEGALAAANAL